jgi:hypothetical protein
MVLVIAGNDALRTVRQATTPRFDQTAYVVTGAAGDSGGGAGRGRQAR